MRRMARWPGGGYETIIMDVTLDVGAAVARHTHPGIESTYVMEGGLELPVQGQPTKMVKAGDAFPRRRRLTRAARRRPRSAA
jgi:quercetin dioxygenase-like cupin family protein